MILTKEWSSWTNLWLEPNLFQQSLLSSKSRGLPTRWGIFLYVTFSFTFTERRWWKIFLLRLSAAVGATMAKLRKLNLICRDIIKGKCKFLTLIQTSYHRFPEYEDLNKKNYGSCRWQEFGRISEEFPLKKIFVKEKRLIKWFALVIFSKHENNVH